MHLDYYDLKKRLDAVSARQEAGPSFIELSAVVPTSTAECVIELEARNSSKMRILVAVDTINFRNGIDGLVRICKEVLQGDPFSGCLFIFQNRRKMMYNGINAESLYGRLQL